MVAREWASTQAPRSASTTSCSCNQPSNCGSVESDEATAQGGPFELPPDRPHQCAMARERRYLWGADCVCWGGPPKDHPRRAAARDPRVRGDRRYVSGRRNESLLKRKGPSLTEPRGPRPRGDFLRATSLRGAPNEHAGRRG